MWVLRALAQFKESERSKELFQDFRVGSIKVQDSPLYCMLNMV